MAGGGRPLTENGETVVPTALAVAYARRWMAFSLLGRLLDIEWLLLRDEGRAHTEVVRHDRALLGAARPSDAEQALALWLDARRRELDERTLGVRVSELLTVLHVTLVGLALAAGAGAAGGLLRSPSAREPTNVLHFLFATLVWPMLLLFGSVAVLLLHGRPRRSVLLEDVYLGLLGVISRLGRSRAHEDWDLAHEWRRLRRGGRRYRDLEVGTLAAAAQWYPLSFHLGAAGCLLASALFSDLAFAWSTTQDSLGWSTLGAVFRAITAPWCLGFDVGCVGPELVRATQFSRFTGQYALPEGAAVSGAWWPALLFCLLTYGVLPRLGLALGLSAFVARRAARLSERVLELRGRLYGGVEVRVGRAEAALDRAEPAPHALAGPAARAGRRAGWVIRWRGVQVDAGDVSALCEVLAIDVVREDAAGGSDFSRDEALLASSAASSAAVVLVVEGWEAPDKATRRFVQALRGRGPADRPVFVCVLLAAADAPELGVWRDRMRLLGDPFVGVEPFVPGQDPARQSSEAVR
jgi:Protein of unknown function (DUF2868)